MIYWALAIVTATSVEVADVYTTREPCERDAGQFSKMMLVRPVDVGCIPTTEGQADTAQTQLENIRTLYVFRNNQVHRIAR